MFFITFVNDIATANAYHMFKNLSRDKKDIKRQIELLEINTIMSVKKNMLEGINEFKHCKEINTT